MPKTQSLVLECVKAPLSAECFLLELNLEIALRFIFSSFQLARTSQHCWSQLRAPESCLLVWNGMLREAENLVFCLDQPILAGQSSIPSLTIASRCVSMLHHFTTYSCYSVLPLPLVTL